VEAARVAAEAAVDRVSFDGLQRRRDIGFDPETLAALIGAGR
jgi:phosphoribosylamine-glycine ligase